MPGVVRPWVQIACPAEGAGPEECGRFRPNGLLGASPRPVSDTGCDTRSHLTDSGGPPLRILSLLPSATEIVFALGLGDSLVGVTAECDYPPAARGKPALSFPAVAPSSDAPAPSAAQVDDAVVTLVASGEPLYRIDEEGIRTLQPDLILAQDLCRVCAVPSGAVTEALDRLGCRATVVSLDPSTLDDVVALGGRGG